MIQEVLRKIGLTENETKVYLALLDLGKATSGEILKKSKLNTGKIYDILNLLKDKGFISEIIESGVKRFSPADPKRIYDYLEEKKQDIEEQESSISSILPDIIKRINAQKQQPHIEIYYGIKGFKTAYSKEIYYHKKGRTLYVMGIMGKSFYTKGLFDYFIYTLFPKREKVGVISKKIYSITTKKEDWALEKNANIRFIDYSSPVSILIIDKLTIIGIHSKENLITMTIESKEVADSFIQQFNLLWKTAKE